MLADAAVAGERQGAVLPLGAPCGQASTPSLAKFSPQDGSAFTWVLNLPRGTDITIKITDGAGATANSSPGGQLVVEAKPGESESSLDS